MVRIEPPGPSPFRFTAAAYQWRSFPTPSLVKAGPLSAFDSGGRNGERQNLWRLGRGAHGGPATDGAGAAGALSEASQLLAQALQAGQAFRRAVPVTTNLVPGAAPPWASGCSRPAASGPLKDLADRDVWIDLFPIVEQVSLVRVVGGVPFMTLPIEIFIHLPGPPSPTVTYDVPAGSVWFASQLLDATAPAGSWTGIQVSGGTVSFSAAVTGTGNEIVVPSGVTVDLNVNTASQPPSTGTGPGQDSRDAIADVPASFRLSVGATAQLTLDPAEVARLSAFGFGTNFTPAAGPVTYNPVLNVLAVPLTAQTSPFTVGSVKATAFSLAGAAPITAAAWALPVAVIDPANLGAASGAGSLMLGLGAGLTGTWPGQAMAVPLMYALLVARPGQPGRPHRRRSRRLGPSAARTARDRAGQAGPALDHDVPDRVRL